MHKHQIFLHFNSYMQLPNYHKWCSSYENSKLFIRYGIVSIYVKLSNQSQIRVFLLDFRSMNNFLFLLSWLSSMTIRKGDCHHMTATFLTYVHLFVCIESSKYRRKNNHLDFSEIDKFFLYSNSYLQWPNYHKLPLFFTSSLYPSYYYRSLLIRGFSIIVCWVTWLLHSFVTWWNIPLAL